MAPARRQGEAATSLFIIISGRVRLVREVPTKRPAVRVEEEVRAAPRAAVRRRPGLLSSWRGLPGTRRPCGGRWASERGVGDVLPARAPSLAARAQVGRGEAVGAVWALTGGHHDTTALCVRDSELVRMSRARPRARPPPAAPRLLPRGALVN
jgi:CRP-like cAMP-binding protein